MVLARRVVVAAFGVLLGCGGRAEIVPQRPAPSVWSSPLTADEESSLGALGLTVRVAEANEDDPRSRALAGYWETRARYGEAGSLRHPGVGDWIASIDGIPTKGLDITHARRPLRGPVGTRVTLVVIDAVDGTRHQVSAVYEPLGEIDLVITDGVIADPPRWAGSRVTKPLPFPEDALRRWPVGKPFEIELDGESEVFHGEPKGARQRREALAHAPRPSPKPLPPMPDLGVEVACVPVKLRNANRDTIDTERSCQIVAVREGSPAAALPSGARIRAVSIGGERLDLTRDDLSTKTANAELQRLTRRPAGTKVSVELHLGPVPRFETREVVVSEGAAFRRGSTCLRGDCADGEGFMVLPDLATFEGTFVGGRPSAGRLEHHAYVFVGTYRPGGDGDGDGDGELIWRDGSCRHLGHSWYIGGPRRPKPYGRGARTCGDETRIGTWDLDEKKRDTAEHGEFQVTKAGQTRTVHYNFGVEFVPQTPAQVAAIEAARIKEARAKVTAKANRALNRMLGEFSSAETNTGLAISHISIAMKERRLSDISTKAPDALHVAAAFLTGSIQELGVLRKEIAGLCPAWDPSLARLRTALETTRANMRQYEKALRAFSAKSLQELALELERLRTEGEPTMKGMDRARDQIIAVIDEGCRRK